MIQQKVQLQQQHQSTTPKVTKQEDPRQAEQKDQCFMCVGGMGYGLAMTLGTPMKGFDRNCLVDELPGPGGTTRQFLPLPPPLRPLLQTFPYTLPPPLLLPPLGVELGFGGLGQS